MCQYYVTRYECGHRNRILELEQNCYLVDADDNSYGCCEKEEYALYAGCEVASPLDCPNCRASGEGRVDGVFGVATMYRYQNAPETKKKATKAEANALESGRTWSKFRARNKPAARNLDGNWRVKAHSPKQMASATMTTKKATVGNDIAMANAIQPAPQPEKPASLVYGAVTILKREWRGHSRQLN